MRAVLVAVLATICTAAIAQPATENTAVQALRADFAQLDRNRDGFISRIEAMADADVQKRFVTFDADKDGRLSEGEFLAAKEDASRRALVDSAITARVKAALLAERGIPSMSISVETYDGRVQLSGFVGSPDIVSRAGRVTATVSGVRTVHNNISVK